MTTTASVVYADVSVLYKPNIYQFQSFFIKIYDILKINISTMTSWASVKPLVLQTY